MTKYLMCIYWGHICIFTSNMKFLSLILWLGGLCTDADNGNANDADNTDNYARWTNHDYIGSFGRIPNEPKSRNKIKQKRNYSINSNISFMDAFPLHGASS